MKKPPVDFFPWKSSKGGRGYLLLATCSRLFGPKPKLLLAHLLRVLFSSPDLSPKISTRTQAIAIQSPPQGTGTHRAGLEQITALAETTGLPHCWVVSLTNILKLLLRRISPLRLRNPPEKAGEMETWTGTPLVGRRHSRRGKNKLRSQTAYREILPMQKCESSEGEITIERLRTPTNF